MSDHIIRMGRNRCSDPRKKLMAVVRAGLAGRRDTDQHAQVALVSTLAHRRDQPAHRQRAFFPSS